MVGVAQLAERLVVVQEVAGSTPVAHPHEIGCSLPIAAEGRTGYPVRPLLVQSIPDIPTPDPRARNIFAQTVLPVTIWGGEPVLHRRATEVEVFDDELRTLIADMFETNDAANGVGLALHPGGESANGSSSSNTRMTTRHRTKAFW